MANKEAKEPGTDTDAAAVPAGREGGRPDQQLPGRLAAAGMTHADHALVPNSGHFTQEEAPEDTWRLIADFSGMIPSTSQLFNAGGSLGSRWMQYSRP